MIKDVITKNTIFVKNEDGAMILKPEAIEEIRDIEIQKKQLDKKYKKYRQAIFEGMEAYGIKKVDTEDLLITYVEETERCSIDQKMLWDKYKDIAFKCQKVSPVSATVKITVR